MYRNVATFASATALIFAMLVPASAAHAADPGTTIAVSQLLADVRAEEPSAAAYNRDLFEHWIDADGDGCDTRSEVLIQESTTPVTVGPGCSLGGGTWASPYDSATWTLPGDVDIDHMVPLAEAWRSGAWAWTADQRRAFANDLDASYALIAVTDNVNQSKSDRDPAEWMPPNTAYTCQYLTDWVLLKYQWHLAVDSAERAAIQGELDASCTGVETEVPTLRIDAPSKGPDGGVVGFSPGKYRLAGPDRFATAVAISGHFEPGVDKVYIATGFNYPDALSASAVAGAEKVPLLLVAPDFVPHVVKAELARLSPKSIVIAGGPTTIWPSVESELANIAPITRFAGVDRYETSRMLAEQGNTNGATTVIATGTNFPDALSSAAAAGARQSSVVLVHGPGSGIDAATNTTLRNLGTSEVWVAGSEATVNAAVSNSLAANYPVTRFAGTDRFHTGALINQHAFGHSDTVFLALGTNFPDALAGGALAGALGAPLFITRGDCVPEQVHSLITSWNPSTVVLLGSDASLNGNVWNLNKCQPPAPNPGPGPGPGPGPAPIPGNPGDSKNCGDFATWRAAQDWFERYYPHYGDIARLDADNDMIACESLPGRP